MLHCEDHWHKFTVMETFTVCRSLTLSTFSPSQPAAFTRPSLTHTSCTSSPSSFLKEENWRTHTHAPQTFPLLQRLKICDLPETVGTMFHLFHSCCVAPSLSSLFHLLSLFPPNHTFWNSLMQTVTYLFTPVKLRSELLLKSSFTGFKYVTVKEYLFNLTAD